MLGTQQQANHSPAPESSRDLDTLLQCANVPEGSGPVHTEPERAKKIRFRLMRFTDYLRKVGVIAKPHRAEETL